MLIRGTIAQVAGDTRLVTEIETGLTIDGKAGWSIKSMRAFWNNGQNVGLTNDLHAGVVLSTESTVTNPGMVDEIVRVDWAVMGSAGTTAAISLERQKEVMLVEPRLTVQPKLFLSIESFNTLSVNTMFWIVEYEVVRLTDLEVMRLVAGGA